MSIELNPEQQKAVTHREGPLLVIAGAGSGKTRIVTNRIVHLIQTGVPAHQILAVTFTNKAAQEMRERVQELTHSPVTICTFHSLGVRILRESIHHLGYDRNFIIYDEDDATKLLKAAMETVGVSEKDHPVKGVRALISNAKNQLVAPEDLKDPEHPWLGQLLSLYQNKLKEYQALDFDDLLTMTVKLLQSVPEVLSAYQERWQYLLVDEYQDTNEAQYRLAQLLSKHTGNLFVVGDPDQSIYSWRGANIHNILYFQRDWPQATVVRLEQNYRSRDLLLQAANRLISHNKERLEKKLWSARGEGNKIKLHVAEDERLEAQFVVRHIHAQRKTVSLDEIVIFYRTNFQSRVLEDALLREQIPYVMYGGLSFYQRKEIKDLLAFLRLLYSPGDFISFMRTINIPKRGFGEATLDKMRILAERRQQPIIELAKAVVAGECSEIRLNMKQQAALKTYLETLHELKLLSAEVSLKELVRKTMLLMDYDSVLKEDKETYEDRKANTQELIAKAAEWQATAENPSLEAFLEELSLKSTLDETGERGPSVHLMTLHNGKGLEFDVAFLVGLEEELFPHINSKDRPGAIEEERRLCYVGMTRAKEQLYLTCATSRYLWGTSRWMRPSRFLSEIPAEFIEKTRF